MNNDNNHLNRWYEYHIWNRIASDEIIRATSVSEFKPSTKRGRRWLKRYQEQKMLELGLIDLGGEA